MTAYPSSIHAVAAAVDLDNLDFGGHTSPDGAITLLLSDIEDAQGVTAALGEQRTADMLRDHSSIVRQLAGVHEGTIVKAHDDGFMVSFASAHSGLRCAIEMQRAFSDYVVPELGHGLAPRIGLHTGFLIADANEFFGRNVVLAARIADRARGGQILVSEALREYTATDPSFHFESLGELRFKGLLGEHEVHAVVWERTAP